jgi:iron complex transport system permease protein
VPSALTGALILTVADLAAQQAPYVQDLPVGVLTLGVGGVYLGYLLVREHSKGRL